MAKHTAAAAPEKTSALATRVVDVTGKALSEISPEHAERIAAALVPIIQSSIAAKAKAMQTMLTTPFVSPRLLAQNECVIELLNVSEGEIQKIGGAVGEMTQQVIYLAALQTPIDTTNLKGEPVQYDRGDVILVAQGTNKVREMWAKLVKEAVDAGETIPNIALLEVPNKMPGLAPSVRFRQMDA